MRKIFTVILVLSLVFTSTSFIFAQGNTKFPDVNGHWATEHIYQLVDLKIIDGYGDGTFRPNNEIKVDEFIKLTVTALGYFPDKSKTGYWADPYIEKAKELKLIEVDEFENYQRYIKREEMASIIVNAYNQENVSTQDNLKTIVLKSINDYSLIDNYYKDSVLESYTIGLITGKSNNNFDPRGYATRAEASTVIMRLLNEDLRKPFDYGDIPYTYVTVNEYDEETGWTQVEYKYYAPINQNQEPVEEVLTLHDEIKAIEKQDYGYHDIIYNQFEQLLFTEFYPDSEILDLPATEQTSHMDMSFKIRSLEFKEDRYPYVLYIWRDTRHYEDMSTYYSYIEDRYGEFIELYVDILFEDEADKALETFKEAINNTNTSFVEQQELVINDRNVLLGTNNGIAIYVTDKISK